MNPKVDQYIKEKLQDWQQPIAQALRTLILSAQPELKETIKWGAPCYVGQSNVVGLVGLKNHISLWFYQGALLKDPQNVLLAASDQTKALRQIRFTHGDPISESAITELLDQAVRHDQEGKRIKIEKKKSPEKIPARLQSIFDQHPKAEQFYKDLAPSYQIEFVEHIASAKRESTKDKRAAKVKDLLLAQKKLNEKYQC
jgi:uncharacterized protein YdeI (YjbR/CyaY-like superfamily)